MESQTSDPYYLFINIQTTGLPFISQHAFFIQNQNSNNCRLVEIGYIICDKNKNINKNISFIIKPQGFTIPNQISQQFHGIYHNQAIQQGQDLNIVLQQLHNDAKDVQIIVSHNINFSINVIQNEAQGVGNQQLKNILQDKYKHCSMEMGQQILKLRQFPKLNDLYNSLSQFQQNQQNNINCNSVSLQNSFQTMKCYFSLTNRFSTNNYNNGGNNNNQQQQINGQQQLKQVQPQEIQGLRTLENYIITFGKHQNKTLKQVYQQDKLYFLWVLNQNVTDCNTSILKKQVKDYLQVNQLELKQQQPRQNQNVKRLQIKYDQWNEIIKYGKFKKKNYTIRYICQNEKKYCQWLIKYKGTDEELNKLKQKVTKYFNSRMQEEEVQEETKEEENNQDILQQKSLEELGQYEIQFGKYEGETLQDIYQSDDGYIKWALDCNQQNNKIQEFKQYLIQYRNKLQNNG